MIFDTIIVGSGPAGCTAALYFSKTMRPLAWFTGTMLGGKPNETKLVDNYLGLGTIAGPELARGFHSHAMNAICEGNQKNDVYNYDVDSIEEEDGVYTVHAISSSAEDNTPDIHVKSKTIIMANGLKPKGLGLENEDKLMGHGVSTCTTCDAGFTKGKSVAVIGGHYAALESALYLSKIAAEVDVIYRRSEFRGDATLRERLSNIGRVNLITDTIVDKYEYHRGLLPDNLELNGLTLKNINTGEKYTRNYHTVFLNVGYAPSEEFLNGNENPATYVKCGDLVNKVKQISTASVSGMEASMKIDNYLKEESLSAYLSK